MSCRKTDRTDEQKCILNGWEWVWRDELRVSRVSPCSSDSFNIIQHPSNITKSDYKSFADDMKRKQLSVVHEFMREWSSELSIKWVSHIIEKAENKGRDGENKQLHRGICARLGQLYRILDARHRCYLQLFGHLWTVNWIEDKIPSQNRTI